jgi:hypothetical protein
MELTLAHHKQLALDILTYTDDVEANGARQKRSTFVKRYYRGATSLREKLTNELLLLVVGDPMPMTQKAYIALEDKPQLRGESMPAGAVEVSDAELKALQYYFAEREELLSVPTEAYDSFEPLLTGGE